MNESYCVRTRNIKAKIWVQYKILDIVYISINPCGFINETLVSNLR